MCNWRFNYAKLEYLDFRGGSCHAWSINAMRMFIRVVETRQFSAAARDMGLTQPTASKLVASLEAQLGVTLLRRTSRQISLTEEGQSYYETVAKILAQIEDAGAAARQSKFHPVGTLCITVSAGFGRLYIVPCLPKIYKNYPDLKIDITVSNRYVDLIEEGLDLALRIGELTDSSLKARRIGMSHFVTVATPNYVRQHGKPETPEELSTHQCLAFRSVRTPRPWSFENAKGMMVFHPKPYLLTNDAEALRASILAGLGIANVPSWLVTSELESGTVIPLLRRYKSPSVPINAVYPGNRNLSAKASTLIPIIREKVLPDSIVYTDSFRAYDVLDVSELHHRRVNHSKVFVSKKGHHINGIENPRLREDKLLEPSQASSAPL